MFCRPAICGKEIGCICECPARSIMAIMAYRPVVEIFIDFFSIHVELLILARGQVFGYPCSEIQPSVRLYSVSWTSDIYVGSGRPESLEYPLFMIASKVQ